TAPTRRPPSMTGAQPRAQSQSASAPMERCTTRRSATGSSTGFSSSRADSQEPSGSACDTDAVRKRQLSGHLLSLLFWLLPVWVAVTAFVATRNPHAVACTRDALTGDASSVSYPSLGRKDSFRSGRNKRHAAAA